MVVLCVREQFLKHFGELPQMLRKTDSKTRKRGYTVLASSAPTYMRNKLFSRGLARMLGWAIEPKISS